MQALDMKIIPHISGISENENKKIYGSTKESGYTSAKVAARC